MKNALWYLGFLSLLSLLYFVKGGTGFLGFLGFLSYFSIYNKNDERLEKNVGRGTRNAFLFTMFFGSAALAYMYMTNGLEFLGTVFTILFGGTLLVGILSIFYYNYKGK
jgi:hypothetical protein